MESDRKGLSIASLIVGIVSLGAWLVPICGLPLSILGLILGILGRASSRRKMAIAGIVICSISLVLGIANGAIGAYVSVTDQLLPAGFSPVPSDVQQGTLAHELDTFRVEHPGVTVQESSIEIRGEGEVLPIDAVEGVGSLYCYEVRIDYAPDETCDSYEVRHGLIARMYTDGNWDYERYGGIGHDVWVEHSCGDFTLSPPPGFCK